MKKIFNILTCMVFLLILSCQSVFAADFSKLVILHTNDTHGFDIRNEERGINGLAVLAQLKKDLIAQGYDVILLDAGDCSQDNNLVNFSKGAAAFKFFNAVGYDAGCLGNHEFDYGQDILLRNIKIAKYPILSSNIIVEATGKSFCQDSTILKVNGLKVGIIGFTTPETIVTTFPLNAAGLKFLVKEDLYAEARNQVQKMKAAGCDLIVGLGHMGSSDACMGNRSDDILMNVDGMDIFVDGHDHLVKNRMVNNTLLVETGSYTQNFGYVHYVDGKWREDMIAYGVYSKEDAKVKKLMEKEQAKVDKELMTVIGESKVNLDGNRAPGIRTKETNLGDFITDALLWQANKANVLNGKAVDLAILNGGDIRDSLKAGKVTIKDVIGVLPYSSQIMVIEITGEKLLEIMEAATSVTPGIMGSFPQVSGMKYTIDTTVTYENGNKYDNSTYYAPAKPGSRVTITEVGGKAFDLKAKYTIATSDFITLGGDSYAGLCIPGAVTYKQGIGYIEADCVQNYIKEELNGVISEDYAEAQNRIIIKTSK